MNSHDNEMHNFSEEDRDLFRESLRRLLADQWPSLKALDLGADADAVRGIWAQLGDLSLSELGRDPDMGGLREILLAFEEVGRAACPAPLLGAVVANLLGLGETNPAAAGDRRPSRALGFGPFDGDRAAGALSLSSERVSGTVHFVEGSATADQYLIFLDSPSAVAIVDASESGIEIRETPSLSLPPLASVSFNDTPARVVSFERETLADIVQIARLCCTARALGSAQRGFDLVVEHATTRRQFGQLIGQFQAVQHRLVDNLTRLDGARLTLDAAATAYDRKLCSWSVFADLALAHASPGLRQLAIDMHQLMGAVGYAEEHELPRHFRQIHGNVTRFGGVMRARAEVGNYLVGAASQAG